MTIRWMLLRASALPEGDDWLGANERKVLPGLKFPKRRSDWRLGRFVAKQALASFTGIDRLDRVEIIADEDGAPDPFIDGRAIESSISISHREDAAACAIAPDARVGCDLEVVEPRSLRFVNDFFTDHERMAVQQTPSPHRDRHVALTWSAKESALKALRTGLTLDTKAVEVEIEVPVAAAPGWQPLSVLYAQRQASFHGWWRDYGAYVITLLTDSADAQPHRLTL